MRLLVYDMLVNVNGIYYVHVCEQAHWACSAGNSAIENLCIILLSSDLVGGYWGYTVTGCVLRVYCDWISTEGILWLAVYWGYTVTGWALRVYCDWMSIEGVLWLDEHWGYTVTGWAPRVYCDWLCIEGTLSLGGYWGYTVSVTGRVFSDLVEGYWLSLIHISEPTRRA